MIILDTNVISEMIRPKHDINVANWIKAQKSTSLYVTTISIAEINRGIDRLPDGKRATNLRENFQNFISHIFDNRIYSFDLSAAKIYGKVCAGRNTRGLHADYIDMMIAAIALSKQMPIATRNVKDFSNCGVSLVNPWNT